MKDSKKLKRWSLANVITGYLMMGLFILLVILNRSPEIVAEEIATTDTDVYADDLFNGVRVDELESEVFYVDGHPGRHTTRVIRDNSIGIDRGHGVILDDSPDVIVIRDDIIDNVAVVRNPDHVVIHDRDNDIYVDNGRGVDIIGGNDTVYNRTHSSRDDSDRTVVGRDRPGRNHNRILDDDIGVVDVHALDQAIQDRDDGIDSGLLDRRLREHEEKIGIDKDDRDFTGLTLARDDDLELGDIDFNEDGKGKPGYGTGSGGQLYAYNFPSQGVGAGIGNGAVGAGAGGSAGIGAGVGEAVLDGQTVPTLGGIGTSSPMPLEGQAEGAPPTDGVGGLVSGAGTGGAAGLVTGTVAEKLGLGVGAGKGCAEHGGDCDGNHGHGKHADYDHLPKDGALHIMIHVDGSGSILDTRKQLDIMKDTLLKDALLPYYNNDESLYNRRVSIVSSSDERSLQFYTLAAKKPNVLAVAFQDEACPVYHLPTFNKKPADIYSKDLGNLKASLNGYGGLYRGIIFQVDRGRTFSKSFKEFVECSWRGEGYLETANLKKYYKDNNLHHIKNRDGIIFSDEYHTESEGDPQYYLDLIFEASKKVGLDLDIYAAGITDGKYNNKID